LEQPILEVWPSLSRYSLAAVAFVDLPWPLRVAIAAAASLENRKGKKGKKKKKKTFYDRPINFLFFLMYLW